MAGLIVGDRDKIIRTSIKGRDVLGIGTLLMLNYINVSLTQPPLRAKPNWKAIQNRRVVGVISSNYVKRKFVLAVIWGNMCVHFTLFGIIHI